MPEFGERLREVMKARGLTQTALAERLGVRQPLISRWVNGGRTPEQESLRRLSDALNVSIDWLVLGLGRMERPKAPVPAEIEAAQKRRTTVLKRLGQKLTEEQRKALEEHKPWGGASLTVFTGGEQPELSERARLVELRWDGSFLGMHKGDRIVVEPGDPLFKVLSALCPVLVRVGRNPPLPMYLAPTHDLALLILPGERGGERYEVDLWTLKSDEVLVLGRILFALRGP